MMRRSFLSGFPAVALFQTPIAAVRAWQAARHAQDDWFDDNAAKHRVIFDTWSPERFPDALLFAGNYIETNTADYDLPNGDLAVVICLHHRATPFAFNDAMWAKHGKAFSERMEWTDPKTHEAPTVNLHSKRLAALISQGVKLAVCSRSTRAYAGAAARRAGGPGAKAEDIVAELKSSTVGASHFVPAGIVSVSRAQERGYASISIG